MNEQKNFDLGVICGRFGHAQLGHVSLFDCSMKQCKRTLILVGSYNEYGTLRNPFRGELREKVIREIYPGIPEEMLTVRGINDLTNEYDITHDWGKYVKEEIISHKGKFANLMVYGNDEFRSNWFVAEDLIDTAEMILPRSRIPVSGTMVRGLLLIDDEPTWQKATHPFIHSMYHELRSELMQVSIYKEIFHTIRKKDFSLENFMETYKVLEEEDKQRKLAELKK